jgi:transglutaminase-like putative cysteine protease
MKANMHSRWDWASAALLILVLFTVSVRLDTTNWTPDLGYVESLAVFGAVLGLVLGISRFKPSVLFWLAFLYTLVIIPMHLSRIITGENTAMLQLASLGGRLLVCLGLLINGKAITDYIFFVTIMSIVFWVIGVYSGYRLVRGRSIFQVLLPSTLPILIIQYYDGFQPDRIWGLALYFFLALMLVGRINLLNSSERWEKLHILAGIDPEFDLNKNIAVAAFVIILAAWLLPAPAAIYPDAALAWQNFSQPFEAIHQRMNDILAALNSNRTNYSTGELYGDVMGLGRVAGSGQSEFFSVQVPQNDLPRLYWRMRAYDTYQNGSWQTLDSRNVAFDPGTGDIVANDAKGAQAPVAEFTFNWRTASQSAMLVTPSQPVWVSRQGSIQFTRDPAGKTDPLSWNALPSLQTGDQYKVRAFLSNPTQKDLRESGGVYPDWINERYLQVPKNNTDEYNRLALQITAGLTNNFDKAQAVTDYLRKNITYSETVPASPPGVDSLNWFLFDWKSGFCDYFASAEVLLLRTQGIPARMVVGFAQGTSTDPGIYSVKGRDAHAWPEVYFNGIGWVQFEPTVNQAVLIRPTGETFASTGPNHGSDFANSIRNHPGVDQPNDGLPDNNTPPEPTFFGLNRVRWLWIIIVIVALLLLWFLRFGRLWQNSASGTIILRFESLAQRVPHGLKVIFTFYNIKTPAWVDRWVRWSEVSSVERAFHAVNQAIQWLDKAQPDYVTPAERVLLLKKLLPDAAEVVDILSASLEKTLFTPYEPADAQRASAVRAAWTLRLMTFRKVMQRWFYG